MIVVLDPEAARAALIAGRLDCPSCRASPLRRWGYAQVRSVRQLGGRRESVRPARARCPGCRATHVLVPVQSPPRSAYGLELLGQALLAGAHGRGHRRIAADLNVPESTVRSWLRRARHLAEPLRVQASIALVRFTPDACATLKPLGSRLAEALAALVAAAIGAARVLGLHKTPLWSIMAMIAGVISSSLHEEADQPPPCRCRTPQLRRQHVHESSA
ncbi:sigma factor-like helix-turn-helix DNA-binding protein [Nonomuraea sp. NPDC003201]